jgi:hypothetical protein
MYADIRPESYLANCPDISFLHNQRERLEELRRVRTSPLGLREVPLKR